MRTGEVVDVPTPKHHYAGIGDIPPEEWAEFFPKSGQEWDQEDIEYLLEWWGRDNIVDLAYALERPPWALQKKMRDMRIGGENGNITVQATFLPDLFDPDE